MLFLSYTRADAAFALRLAEDLRAAGVSLWIDQLNIRLGERWDTAVEAALRECHGVVAILSPAAIASQNVMDEISYALDEQKNLIPIICTPCNIPLRIRRLQSVSFVNAYDQGVAKLLTSISPKTDLDISPATLSPQKHGALSFDTAASLTLVEEQQQESRQAAPSGWSLGRKSRAANRARLAFEESQKQRHLEPREAATIIKIASEGLRKLAEEWLRATPPVVIDPIKMAVIAIGTDAETKNYRNEIADAFHGAGFAVDTQEWQAGPPQYREFTAAVSVLEGRPTNQARRFVMDAFQRAGIPVKEVQFPPIFLIPGYREISASVWIVVGQRE